MALLLHIETATPTCSVALSWNGQLLSLEERTAPNIHAGVITLFMEAALERAGRKPEELDGVCVSKGPGSYTGLRIGTAAAKGFCYALDKPLIAVNTLKAMAAGLLRQQSIPPGSLLCPMLDARRMEVYMAVYDTGLKEVERTSAAIIDGHTFDRLPAETDLVLFGTGADKCRAMYEGRPRIVFASRFRHSAANLILPAEEAFGRKAFEDVAYFEPYYLKEFVGKRKQQ